MSHWKIVLMAGVAVTALAWGATYGAHAQDAPDGRMPFRFQHGPANDQPPIYDPNQLPAFKGTVLQFTSTPRGDADGFILKDGTEVKIPPHLSAQLIAAVKVGDAVTIHGLKAASLPLVLASSITDQASGTTVVDNGLGQGGGGGGGPGGPGGFGHGMPRRPGGPPPGAAAGGTSADDPTGEPLPGLTEVQGEVKMLLHGPRADVNGVLLVDGTVLRLSAGGASRLADLLQPGKTVVAEGDLITNPVGKLIMVRQLGASRDQLHVLQGPFVRPRGLPEPREPAEPPPPNN